MATQEQILKLAEALRRAKECAGKLADTNDDGTCNFDTPQITLVKWREADIKKAFDLAGLRYYISKGGIVDIIGCASGQASRRTAMAEAVRDSLVSDGYEAYVYYKMN